MTKNIVLVGLMGSGKSTAGKMLAEKLDWSFIDTDSLIEKRAGQSITDIFKNKGEPYFRELECSIIKEISTSSSCIISTGGGCLEREENILNLKQNGVLFYLYAPPEVLYERIKEDNTRPLLNNDNPLGVLKNLLIKREKFYNQSDIKIDTINITVEELVNLIIEKYNEFTNS